VPHGTLNNCCSTNCESETDIVQAFVQRQKLQVTQTQVYAVMLMCENGAMSSLICHEHQEVESNGLGAYHGPTRTGEPYLPLVI
jgi:hypothetical protein